MRAILLVHVVCGNINLEVYSCDDCGLVIDRDATGSRNIFIKNSRLLCTKV